uniref:Uncharacterized protein n=1 Tax=Salmonella sp. TaxID=599 RepID=A0A482EX63_SALSP|nr:hypothetical protein NNIBIDOC_00105 [Salmonella sp.]
MRMSRDWWQEIWTKRVTLSRYIFHTRSNNDRRRA